eukprot:TRINITY_DN4425_c0_g1_i1.p1 TRINITY_DN4425_c0_g1~~TRINITY_DN4425_c0_g1_i1.p1  ORF type:complete len:286 (-),score=57.80 TRINITY_DN4425_c0_g1_i1:6-863(-)
METREIRTYTGDYLNRHNFDNISEIWHYFIQYQRDKSPDHPNILSEWIFYLRFFYTETDHFFGIPEPSSEYYAAYDLYRMVSQSRRDAWMMLMDSKLSDITACGHLADTFIQKVYFSDKHTALACRLRSECEEPVSAVEALLEWIEEEEERSFIVKVEVNDNHVLLCDIPVLPLDSKGHRWVYHIESVVRVTDGRVKRRQIGDFMRKLREGYYGELDLIEIYQYDQEAVCRRAVGSLKELYSRLDERVSYFSKEKTMSEVLDFVHRIKVEEQNDHWVWHRVSDFL